MSNESVKVGVDIDLPQAEMNEFDSNIKRLGTLWAKTKRMIKEESQTALYIIRDVISMVKNFASFFGATLDPTQEAILAMIGSVVSGMISIAVAAGSTIVGIPLAMYIATAAATLSVVGTAASIAKMDEARQQISALQGAMSNLSMISMNIGRAIG